MKKDVLSGIVLVFSLIILFSLFLSGAVSADVCSPEMIDWGYAGEGGGTDDDCQAFILTNEKCPPRYDQSNPNPDCVEGCSVERECYCHPDETQPGRYVIVYTSKKLAQSCGACAFGEASLCSGLAHYWPFDTASGTVGDKVVDVISGNNGTATGSPISCEGIKGEAYSFDGINDYLSLQKPLVDMSTLTIGAWVYVNGDGDYTIFSDLNSMINNDFVFSVSKDSIGIRADKSGNVLYSPENSVGSLNLLNSWHYLVWVMNPSGSKIYLDGVLLSDITQSGSNVGYHAPNPCIGCWWNYDLPGNNVGEGPNGNQRGSYFKGKLDEIVIWNRVLSASEVQQIYTYYVPQGNVNPYWANMIGKKINVAQVGDTVKMIATGEGFDTSKPMNYTLYTDTTIWFIRWTTPLSSILSVDIWQIPPTYGISNSVYFIAQQGSIVNTSETIDIGDDNNSMPFVNITSPNDGAYLAVNELTNFYYTVYDEDDLLQLTWDFGDGTNYTVYNYSIYAIPTSDPMETHTYTNQGVYTITLTVSEMPTRTNPQSLVVTRKVYVFKEGINVFPIITSPVRGVNYGNFVNFDASESFVANCTKSVVYTECIDPISDECLIFFDWPVGCSNCFAAGLLGELSCEYLHLPGAQTVVSGHNLSVSWNIYSGSNSVAISKTGQWAANYSQIVKFTDYFANADTHEAVLMLDYN